MRHLQHTNRVRKDHGAVAQSRIVLCIQQQKTEAAEKQSANCHTVTHSQLSRQSMSSKRNTPSATSLSKTTTTTTVMAHPFDQHFNVYLIKDTFVARPDGMSVEQQIADKLTMNWIEDNATYWTADDAFLDLYIHHKPDGAISHNHTSNVINRISNTASTQSRTTTIPITADICTYSRPLRCLYMTVSRELLLVVCECWPDLSKGRVVTACASLFGKLTVVDSLFFVFVDSANAYYI